jgi:hypothetical protein
VLADGVPFQADSEGVAVVDLREDKKVIERLVVEHQGYTSHEEQGPIGCRDKPWSVVLSAEPKPRTPAGGSDTRRSRVDPRAPTSQLPNSVIPASSSYAWGLVGGGTVAAVSGLVLYGVGAANHNTAQQQRSQGDSAERLNSSADKLKNVAYVVWGSSALLVAAAIIGMLSASSTPQQQTRAGLQISGWASESFQGIQVQNHW